MMFCAVENLFSQFGSPALALLPDGFFFISSLAEHETEKKTLT